MSDVQVNDPDNQNLDDAQYQDIDISDTQDAETTPPVEDVDGNGGTGSTSNPQAQNSPEDVAAKREAGKLKQYQETLNRYGIKDINEVESLMEYKKRFENVEKAAMQSPEKYKKALIEFNGMSDQEAELEVTKAKMQGYWKQPVAQAQPQQQNNNSNVVPIEFVKQIVETSVAETKQKDEAQRKFFENFPDLDPKKIEAGYKPVAKAIANAIVDIATYNLSQDSSLDFFEEAQKAYKIVTGKSDEQLQEARESGKLEGLALRNAKNNTVNQQTRGTSIKTASHGLSAAQLAEAEAEGLTPEEYLKYSNDVVSAK